MVTVLHWANEYIVQTADKLLLIENPGKTAPQQIYKAIGIRGKDFSDLRDRNLDICADIEKLKDGERSEAAAYRLVSKSSGKGVDAVKKIHLKKRSEVLYRLLMECKKQVG